MTIARTILIGIYSRFPAWNIPAENVAALRNEFPQHTFLHARNTDEAFGMIASADIVFTAYMRQNVLDAAQKLQWLHSSAAGLEGVLVPSIIDSPVVVTNSRGLSADTIAEHVVAVVFALFRKLPAALHAQRAREWSQTALVADTPPRLVSGSRVLIAGLGGIGLATAKRFAALSAHVDAVRRRPTLPRPPYIERVAASEQIRELLPSADVVVLAAPGTRTTRHLIGPGELAAMRPGSILVNVSRGTLVDESALVAALTSSPETRTIRAAALDVFEHEPLPADSPLWNLSNVLITPHVAGFRPDHWEAVCRLFADNLHRFDSGQPLQNVVDKREGY